MELGSTDAAEPTVQLCAFAVGTIEYAIDLMRVEEILRPQPITPLPESPPWIEGVASLRGNLLPVVHLRRRLGLEAVAPTPKARLLVCWLGRRRVGFMVDRVIEVMRVKRENLRPAPPLLATSAASYVIGVCGPADRLRLLMDLKALLSSARPADEKALWSSR